MAPRHSEEDSQLIADLHKLSKKSPKLVKSSTYPAPADPETIVRSWKMNEFKYYDIPSPFPTLARGIFTVELPNEGAEGTERADTSKYRIIARGYDKFFNIGEVPWTTWSSLEAHTAAPFTLSLKSNGCIIFIAALTPSKLLITSKHSIGPVAGHSISHAQAGEQWLRSYFEQKGKSEQQLAATLWENNWTAIAELCDDSFEEHVLGYPPEKTGLHLHGINECTKQFKTLSHDAVDAFADEWGFIKTLSTTLNSIAEVKSFTQEVGETGKWNGEAVEGFVVRTHVTEPPTEGRGGSRGNTGISPYAPGSSFFFKVKFDEPYMMYRDWREVTKSLLSAKGPMNESKIPKSKMKRPETRLYVRWVIQEIKKDPKSFDQFTKGKGIIATRERFLQWLATEKGKKDLKGAKVDTDVAVIGPGDKAKNFGKTIIVPVAIPGCGKTTVAVALAHIFGFGHTQSDDVQAKKAAPVFIKNVIALLKDHDIVIADKNNHLRQHRQALRVATARFSPPVRLLALNWSLDQPLSTIHRICGDRVLYRGENHQSLRADTKAKAHEDVIWQFITGTEGLAGSEVDASIEMELEEPLEKALQRAVEGCVKVLGLPMPSEEKVKEALDVANGYAPKVKKTGDTRKKDTTARYFGLLPEIDLDEVLGKRLLLGNDVSKESKDFWTHLKAKSRVPARPHVTIVHKNSLPAEVHLWDRCLDLHKMQVPPLFKFRLGNVVWNDRVMAATVDEFELDSDEDLGGKGHEFVSTLPHDVRERLHITVGTRDTSVPAVEAKGLVQKWRAGDLTGNVQSIKLEGVAVKGRIKGMF